MWQILLERLPSIRVCVCAAMSALIPYVVYRIHQKLLKFGSPPWKQDEPRV